MAIDARLKNNDTPADGDDARKRKRLFWQNGVAYPSRVISDMYNLEKIYKLRYDIYCIQKGFLDPADYPTGIEKDQFDDFSTHFGAFDDDGSALGTLRLVHPSDLGFPLFEHCEVNVPSEILATAGEISRLAVSRQIRRRQDDGDYGMAVEGGKLDDVDPENIIDRRRKPRPDIVVGLYKTLYQESKRRGITHWIAAMEPGLVKLLKRFYFNFTPIGPEVDYYGPVRPYMAEIEQVEHEVYHQSRDFYRSFVDGLEEQYIPYPV